MISNLSKNPRRMMAIGMACLVLGIVPEFLRPASQLDTNVIHFFRGLFLGISIVLNLAAASLTVRRRRCGS
jgi:hypothetical protein